MPIQKQIIFTSSIIIAVITILFLSTRIDYSQKHTLTSYEINGIEDIADIYRLDILLKSIRGISQLDNNDAIALKKSLFIDDYNTLKSIKKIQNKEIENLYMSIISQQDTLSKMQLFTQYTKLLKKLNNIRIDKADSSFLLFESDREINFLITITLFDIPKIIENIGKIRALGIQEIDSTNINTQETFLLKNNLKSFTDTVEEIKYTIEKLQPKEKNRLNILLNSIISDFHTIKIIVSDVEAGKSKLNSKEYFLEISKLVNKIDNLFSISKESISLKLEQRKSDLNNKIFIGTSFYILLIVIIFFNALITYRKANIDSIKAKKKSLEDAFIQEIQNDYTKHYDLKQLCDISLNHIIEYFNALNGSLYLFNEENKKLYLGSVYGIKEDDLDQTLSLHENLISENILEKKMKILDINQKTSLGTIEIKYTKLVLIPIVGFKKSIGTIQLVFDNRFNSIDSIFLKSVISLMGTYINKAQRDAQSLAYLKLIDKNVLISKTDLDGNILEISERLCQISQYSKEELLGKTHRIFKHEDMKAEVFIDLWKSITKGEIWNGEIKNKKKNGDFYWVDTTVSPNFNINGNIIGYTAMRIDITDKKKIEQIAITDGLTSLYNRRHFDTIFIQQIEVMKREKNLLAFVLIDIDHFKQYNDMYGHLEGDRALKLVASTLKKSLKRPTDYVFRLGGEEFGLLYHIKDASSAQAVADKARENIENLKIEHLGNSASKYLTISSGLYIMQSDIEINIDLIYKKTDEALYKSKQNGRNLISLVK